MYSCKCCNCHKEFLSENKRAVTCPDCKVDREYIYIDCNPISGSCEIGQKLVMFKTSINTKNRPY